MKRVAYLIMAHDDPKHLARLINALNSSESIFFIHINICSDLEQFTSMIRHANVHFIEDRVSVQWGGWTVVQAAINLINAAYAHDSSFDYYTLMSGSHFPIKPVSQIHAHLTAYGYLDTVAVPNKVMDRSMKRFSRYYWEGCYRNSEPLKVLRGGVLRALSQVTYRNPKKFIGDWDIYAGSLWFTLSRDAIEDIRFHLKDAQLIEFFRHTKLPDEGFFHTILGNGPRANELQRADVYLDWTDPYERPCHMKAKHMPALLAPGFELNDEYGRGPAHFARKFTSANADLVDQIEENLGNGYQQAAPEPRCLERARA